jgi:cell wall-associated NlpC family hydrolase
MRQGLAAMSNALDPRTTPARPDLAARSLEGRVEAARFVDGTPMRVAAALAPLRREPRPDAPLDTEALCGEPLTVYEVEEGWAWAQLAGDAYVGYVPAADLAPPGDPPTHRVAVLRTFVYPGPDMKLPPVTALAFGACVTIARLDGIFAATREGGAIIAAHLVPVSSRQPDCAATALAFLGVPYLWGGKTSLGLDCSALMQLSLLTAGIACPRDSDMQEASVGAPIAVDARLTGLRRGDLVFWKGHVGMMLDGERIVHASGHHMLVVAEPLAETVARLAAKDAGGITRVRRLTTT